MRRYARYVTPGHDLLRGKFTSACLLLGLLLCDRVNACAAQMSGPLPESPGSVLAGFAQSPQAIKGEVSGTVVDATGAAVSQAKVTLKIEGAGAPTTQVADDDGQFRFTLVPGGRYSVVAEYPGMIMPVLTGTLEPGEHLELNDVKMTVTDVAQVDAITVNQQAEMELSQEETQRLVGIVPNYYVVYNWDAAPLSTKQKYKLALRNTIDPFNAGISAAVAGYQYSRNDFSGYGSGPGGYFKRFGANMGDLAVGTFVGGAVLPSLLHQDPRYFYMGKGSVMHRALYAISTAVICRGDNGKWQPNYSSIGGDIAAGAIAELYYPKTDDNGATKVIENGLIGALLDGAGNLVQEFLLKRFTPHAAKYASTTPDKN
jgi:hypothetical protein